MIAGMPRVPAPAAVTPPTQARNSIRIWRFWKMPVLAGFGFVLLQIGLLFARFGLSVLGPQAQPPQLSTVLSGVGLFWLAGVLAGLIVRGLLRGAQGRWRVCLIVLTVAATPFALLASLSGGLLGPPLVVLYATVPYMMFVGIPALGCRLWRLLASRAGS